MLLPMNLVFWPKRPETAGWPNRTRTNLNAPPSKGNVQFAFLRKIASNLHYRRGLGTYSV